MFDYYATGHVPQITFLSSQHKMVSEAVIDTSELVQCARYGEFEEFKQELARLEALNPTKSKAGILSLAPNDGHGNTALHMASANGHAGA
jgi:hypothetical protein